MRADELKIGDVINYRGDRAVVVECWTDGKCKDRGFGPVGCVIEFQPFNNPESVRVRLEWPERLPSREDRKNETPEDYAARLLAELDSVQLTPWGE